MKKIIFILLGIASLIFGACSNVAEFDEPSSTLNSEEDFHCDLQVFKNQTKGIIDSLAEKSFNYNTTSTRTRSLDEDTLDVLVTALATQTEKFLNNNEINTDSIYSVGSKEQMAYIGLLLLDYEKTYLVNQTTRASIGDCVLRGAGIGELTARGLSKRTVMRLMLKVALKRCVPYIGWGLFIGETAACLAGY